MLSQIGLVVLLALLNGFFALSEIAIVASRTSRLMQNARTSRRARLALELSRNPERMLSTVQIGITLIGIVIGAVTGASIGEQLGTWLRTLGLPLLADHAIPVGMALSVAIITYLNIIIGELVPKRIALVAPEKIAMLVAWPMSLLARVSAPLVWVLNISSGAILSVLRLRQSAEGTISEEEIRLLVAESAAQGVLDSDERNMVNRVLRLGDRDVESVMTPRPRIAWLSADADPAENLAVLASTPYSRYPVYRGDESRIVGILEVKTLVEDLASSQASGRLQGLDLFSRLARPLYVPATARALDILESFREAETGMALVVDEYGAIDGLITVNDLLETVIGHSPSTEESDPDGTSPVIRRRDGSFLLDGSLPVDDLRELLASNELPRENEHEFNTVAGMMMANFGHIPETGESFDWNGHSFEVMDLDGARIDKVLLQPAPDAVTRATPGE